MKKNPIALVMALTMLLTGCAGAGNSTPDTTTNAASTTALTTAADALSTAASEAVSTAATTAATTTVMTAAANGVQPITIQYMVRTNLLGSHYSPVEVSVEQAQKSLTANADLSNVDFNGYRFTDPNMPEYPVDWVTKEQEELLKKNGILD